MLAIRSGLPAGGNHGSGIREVIHKINKCIQLNLKERYPCESSPDILPVDVACSPAFDAIRGPCHTSRFDAVTATHHGHRDRQATDRSEVTAVASLDEDKG